MLSKNSLLILVCIILGYSCQQNNSVLQQYFNCNFSKNSNVKTHKDINKNFTIAYPKNWETKYYYDNVTSSVFTADTTLSFTKTTIIDATFVLKPTAIDSSFIQKIVQENQINKFQNIKSESITFLENNAYINLSKGKKRSFDCTSLNLFIEQPTGFLQVKTDIYGNEKVEERLCKAIQIINTLTIL